MQAHAAVDGFSIAFLVGAGVAAVGVVLTLLFIPPFAPQEVTAGEPAFEVAG